MAEQQFAPVRVLIVEDHTLVRQSVAKGVGAEPGFIVVGEASRGDEALALARRTLPDVVLLDVTLGTPNGLDVAAALRAEMPGLRIIFLTMHDDEATVARALSLGADGYLLKTSSFDTLLSGLRAVSLGGSYLDPGVARHVMRRAASSGSILTERELEVLRLLADGRRPADIATTLYVSIRTVRNHLANIYMKLGVRTAGQAVAEAFQRGFVARSM
jgi:DNA-binding NarL/FixJ family response regulator